MTQRIDFYWSFRSPYCYLSVARAKQLASTHDLKINMRVVYPLAIRFPEFFVDAPPQRISYPRLDRARVAQYYQVPFADPDPDPLLFGPDKRPLQDQPHIHRLTRLGIEATRRGKGFDFCDRISELIWSGGVSGWHLADHLNEATAKAGLDLVELDQAIEADPDGYDKEAADNFAALSAAGHWGVPTFVLNGEPFFGQDRLEILAWRLDPKKAGET